MMNDNTEQAVSFAANILEISEYELFCIAWHEWHGQEPNQDDIDQEFGAFLDCGSVPFYVASYVRNILSDDQIISREMNARLRAQFIYYVPLFVCFVLFMYFLLN